MCIKNLINLSKIKSPCFGSIIKASLLLLLVVVAVLLLKPWELFYEDQIYILHLKSIISDGDFNIINQVARTDVWLANDQYFFPTFHSEIQSAFLYPLLLLESITNYIVPIADPEGIFHYSLTAILLNIISIGVFIKLLIESAKLININVNKMALGTLVLATPILYFGILQATVIEVFSLPLMMYLIFYILQIKAKQKTESFVLLMAVVGIVVTTKVTLWPVGLGAFFYGGLNELKEKKIKTLIGGVVLFLLVASLGEINNYIKNGVAFDSPYLNSTLAFAFDKSFQNVFSNIIIGTLSVRGIFYFVPMYFISIIGLFLLCKNLLKTNFFNIIEVILIFSYLALLFFNHIFMLNYIVEDHLPGRIHLPSLAIISLGFLYLYQHIFQDKKPTKIILCAALIIWNVYLTSKYMFISQINAYLFSTESFHALELIKEGFEKYLSQVKINLIHMQYYWVQIIIYCFVVGTLYDVVKKFKNLKTIAATYFFASVVSYSYMTYLNFNHSAENIKKLKSREFFNNIVIGKGGEIMLFEYITDYLVKISYSNDAELLKKVDIIKDKYFEKVKKQVLVSTQAFDKVILERKIDFGVQVNKNLKSKH